MREESVTFEQSLHRLEEIVRKMEGGDLPLEQALALFEEGTGLVKTSNQLLDEAELKLKKMTKGADGAPVEEAFES
ncbi:MAG: exodeoxyribonuclease VII small subunit [Eubacteriales bacterium]